MKKPNVDDFLSSTPHLLSKYINSIFADTEADPMAIAAQFLVIFGNCIGRTSYFVMEGTRHYTNLYMVIVGKSAKARKGTSWEHAMAPFRVAAPDWVKSAIVSGLSSGEGIIAHCSREETKGVVLVQEAEFAGPLKNFSRQGNTLSTTLREGWDGKKLQIITRNDPVSAENVHLSVVGHITRNELQKELSQTEATNGLANRVIWIYAQRSKELPLGGRKTEISSEILEILKNAISFAKTERAYSFDAEAEGMWVEKYSQLSKDRSGFLGEVLSRAEAQVLRLSLIFAILDLSTDIKKCHLERALFIWDYSEWSANQVFEGVFSDRNQRKLFEALDKEPNGLTREEVNKRVFSGNLSSQQIQNALNDLQEQGVLIQEIEMRDRGIRVERWRLRGANA